MLEKKQLSNFLAAMFFGIISSALMFCLSVGVVKAVETSPMNLTFSPVTLSLETNPGESTSRQIKIRNNSDKTEELKITFGSFVADASGEKPKLLEPSKAQAFLPWLTADQSTLTILPGEWATLTVTFAPPPEAALGYYYAVYFQRTQIGTSPGETEIQGSPAVLVLTNVVSPLAKRQLELSSFSVERPMTEFLPQTFNVTIKNTGNVHVIPNGNIFIDGQGKKDLAVLSLNPNSNTIMPQSSRTFSVTWIEGFPRRLSQSNPAQTSAPKLFGLEWDLAKADTLRFGSYTAHLLMVYDNGQRDVPIESFVSFWVLPWRLTAIVVLILSFAGIGLISTTKNLRDLWRKKS